MIQFHVLYRRLFKVRHQYLQNLDFDSIDDFILNEFCEVPIYWLLLAFQMGFTYQVFQYIQLPDVKLYNV